jgi:SlyX protein
MFTIHGQSPNLQGQLMNEERLENIETKIAYQEDLIEELNKSVYQQQKELERLKATCVSLASHIASLYESSNESKLAVNEKPPHY